MKKLIKILLYPFKLIGIGLVYLYKFLISPILPHTCRFFPTCSTYAIQAISHFGLIRGIIVAIKRIIRCNPKSAGGFDFIPFDIRGEEKWLL